METHTPASPANATNRNARQISSGTLAGDDLPDLPLVSTKKQLAAVLRVSAKHVENLTARGLLRPVRLGRCVRYRREAVLRALKEMEGTAA